MDQVALEILNLKREIQMLRSSPPSIPRLQEDPGAESRVALWMLDDGRLRGRDAAGDVIEYAFEPSPGGSTSSDPPPTAPYIPATAVLTVGSSWSRSFTASELRSTGTLYFGDSGDGHGENFSMIGWSDDALSDLAPGIAGTRILQVQLVLNFTILRSSSCEIRMGLHSDSDPPSEFEEDSWAPIRAMVSGTGEKEISLPVSVGYGMSEGSVNGVTIRQNSSSSALYGVAIGNATSSYPKLKVTYVN